MKDRRWFLSYFSFGKAIIVLLFSPGKSASVHNTHRSYCAYILLCSLPADEFPIQSTRFAEKYFLRMRLCNILLFFFFISVHYRPTKRRPGASYSRFFYVHYNILLYYSRGGGSRNRNEYGRVRAHSSRRKRIKKKKKILGIATSTIIL